MEERINTIQNKLLKLEERVQHLAEDSYAKFSDLVIEMKTLTSDIKWVLKIGKFIFGTVVAYLVASLIFLYSVTSQLKQSEASIKTEISYIKHNMINE